MESSVFRMISAQLSAALSIVPQLLVLYVAYRLLRVIRNRLRTDLNKIPSPPIAPWKAFTIGHDIFSLMMNKGFEEAASILLQWHDDYGPTIRLRSIFGESEVFTTSIEAVRHITVLRHRLYVKEKALKLSIASVVGNDGILLAEGDLHAKLRRAVSPALRHDALVAVGDIFLREGRVLAGRLSDPGDSGSQPCEDSPDILRIVRERTFRVILETVFGTNNLPPELSAKFCSSYLDSVAGPPARTFQRILLLRVFWFLPATWFGYREDLKKYVRNVISELCNDRFRTAKAKGSVSLLSLMVDEETRKAIPLHNLVDSVLSFIAAGQGTTSMSVCWTLYLLAKDEIWQARVVNELRNEWRESDGLEKLDSLPLLSCVVRESLRLYPPLLYLTRTVTQDDTLDGFKIPAGTHVRVPVLAIHRDEKTWGADAGEFNPRRFLNEKEVARTRMSWQPFLYGPRSCIGQRFAILEMKAFLAQVLLRLRVYIQPSRDLPPTCFGLFATPQQMKLYFEPRCGR